MIERIADETRLEPLTKSEIREALGIDKLSPSQRAVFMIYLWWMQPELRRRKPGDDINALHRTPRAFAVWFAIGVVFGLPIIILFLSQS